MACNCIHSSTYYLVFITFTWLNQTFATFLYSICIYLAFSCFLACCLPSYRMNTFALFQSCMGQSTGQENGYCHIFGLYTNISMFVNFYSIAIFLPIYEQIYSSGSHISILLSETHSRNMWFWSFILTLQSTDVMAFKHVIQQNNKLSMIAVCKTLLLSEAK